MEKVMSILGVATKIMTFLVVTVVAILSLATAYIIFAPDEFPKPFRVLYADGSSNSEVGGATTGEAQQPSLPPTPTPEPPKPGEGVMFNMSTKIINLADPTSKKYIRLTVVLEFMPHDPNYKTLPEEEKTTYLTEFQTEITNLMPIMDDVVIKLLSTKTFEELYTAEGKEKLRQELANAIQQAMPGEQLISVYFTEFVVQ